MSSTATTRFQRFNQSRSAFLVKLWFCVAIAAVIFVGALMWAAGFLGVFFGFVVVPFIGLLWIMVLVSAVIEAWSQRDEWKLAVLVFSIPFPALALLAVLAIPIVQSLNIGLDWVWFFTKRSQLEKIVTLAEDGQFDPTAPGFHDHEGTDFLVDSGPPVRIAFKLPGGLLDNWSSVIYDPTGEVTRAAGFDPGLGAFKAPDSITRLFGGDLLFCRPMRGDFYRCQFT